MLIKISNSKVTPIKIDYEQENKINLFDKSHIINDIISNITITDDEAILSEVSLKEDIDIEFDERLNETYGEEPYFQRTQEFLETLNLDFITDDRKSLSDASLIQRKDDNDATLIMDRSVETSICEADFEQENMLIHSTNKRQRKPVIRFQITSHDLRYRPRTRYKSRTQHKLQSHVFINHDQIKQFNCEKCSYSAYSQFLLKIHIDIVHEKKKYSCEKCSYSARSKFLLKSHVISIHEKR